MATLDYLVSFQTVAVVYVIIAIGYFVGGIKLFTSAEVNSLRRLSFLVTIPGMYFEIIGNADASMRTWTPLLYTFLTQIVLHMILFLVCYFQTTEDRIMKFTKYCYAATYPEYIFYSYPVIQTMFGQKYCYIPILSSIVVNVIINPFHQLLIMYDNSLLRENYEQDSDHGDSNIRSHMLSDVHADGLPKEQNMNNINDGSHNHEEENHETEAHSDEGDNAPSEPIVPKWRTILFLFINSATISIILGIIWSFLPWDMPKFLSGFVNDLEMTVVAAGLFVVGVNMWEHPFIGCNPTEVIVFSVVHVLIIPLLTAIWAILFKEDKTVIKAIIITNVTPSALIAFVSSASNGFFLLCPSFTFFYTNLISIGVFLLWITAINETHILE